LVLYCPKVAERFGAAVAKRQERGTREPFAETARPIRRTLSGPSEGEIRAG